MGFRQARRKVIECLNNGQVLYDLERSNIDVKNLLATGEVSREEAAEIIGRARGNQYDTSSHHFDQSIEVHIITTSYDSRSWYIKWFYIEPDVTFISFHE